MKCAPFFLALLLACGRSSAPSDSDEWYSVKVNGAKSGYEHVVRRTEGGTIRTERKTETSIKRAGTALTIREESVHEETAGGVPIRFTEKKLMAAQELVYSGEIKAGKLKLTSQAGTKEIDWKDTWLFPAARDRLIRDKVASGQDIAYTEYLVEYGGPATTLMRPKGKEGDLYAFEAMIDVMKGITIGMWLDAEGRIVKRSMNVMTMDMVVERTDAASAMMTDKGEIPEVFINTLLRPKQKFGDPRKLAEALYRITAKTGALEEKAFRFEGQTIERAGGNVLVVRVRPPQPRSAVTLPVAGMADYLKPNDFLQSTDPRIVEAAKQAVGNETDAWKAARAIESWVYRNMRKRNLGVAFAHAKEVAERLEGDCTEHAVLAAAMCRAAGLPSRVAIGLAAVQDFYGGHMWTEVWVGEWVPIDATFGAPFVDASHLKMGESDLNDSGIAREFMNVLVYLGRIELDVLEYEADGRRVTPQ